MENRTYISERAIAFDVPKIIDGKKVPILNDYGHPIRGAFEEHSERFIPFQRKKVNGEFVATSVYLVTEKTPKEVIDYIEAKLVATGLCELQQDYDKRTNPDKAHAIRAYEAEKARADDAEKRAKESSDYIAELEREMEKLKKKARVD